MMWGYSDAAWVWMLPVMLMFWGAVIAAIIVAIRVLAGSRGPDDQAVEILRKRLASGEITPDEYEKMKRLLQA